MNWSIRAAEEKDSEPLYDLMSEYIIGFYQCKHPGEDKLRKLIARLLERRDGIQFVAERNGGLIGFATLYFTCSTLRAGNILVLNDLYLREDARGSGAAKGLFDACQAYGAGNGFEAMNWETAKGNVRAQAFYAKMGGARGDWLNYSLRLV